MKKVNNKNNKKIVKTGTMQRFAMSFPAAGLVILMAGVFPLFYTNNYINIIQSKRFIFEVISIMTLVTAAIIILVTRDIHSFVGTINERIPKSKKICIVLLLLGLLISTLVSDMPMNSLTAPDGRKYGVIFMLLCIFAYVFTAAFFVPGRWVMWIVCIVNGFMSILIIADNWKKDILGMKSNLVDYQFSKFTGTMGNININASYFAIIFPLVVTVFYISKKMGVIENVLMMICCMLLFATGLCIRSDSIIWCTLLCVVIINFNCYLDGDKVRYIKMVLINGALVMSYFITGCFYNSDRYESYHFSELGVSMCRGKGLYAITVLFAVSLIMMIIKIRFKDFDFTKSFKVGTIVLCCIIAAGAILIIAANIFSSFFDKSPLSKLVISESFGTNRGYVWKRTISMIKKEGFVYFVTGHGMNRFFVPFYKYFYEEMMSRFTSPYIDAHNELLQMLVTTVIMGCAGYMGMMISGVYNGVKKYASNPLVLVEVMVLSSYLLQGIVNNPQVFTLPLIFLFMGAVNNLCETK